MRTTFLLILLSLSSFLTVQAQDNCACCTPKHTEFDFWLGEWEVYSTENQKLGESSITKLDKECIIQEQWTGESGITGRSLNYYDPEDQSWNQLWLDSGGSRLQLKGRLKNGSIVMQSKLTKGKKIEWYYDRITWTKIDDKTVSQLWEILNSNEQPVAVAFHGVYRRKGHNP